MSRALRNFKKKLHQLLSAEAYASTKYAAKYSAVNFKRRFNILTYSQDIANAAWSKVNMTALGAQLAGDGTPSAYGMVPSVASTYHYMRRTLVNTKNSDYISLSIDFLPETSNNFQVLVRNGSSGDGTERVMLFTANTLTNVVSYTISGGTVTGDYWAFPIESIGGGWKRMKIITQSPNLSFGTAYSSEPTEFYSDRIIDFRLMNNSGQTQFAGDGSTSMTRIWRVQAEAVDTSLLDQLNQFQFSAYQRVGSMYDFDDTVKSIQQLITTPEFNTPLYMFFGDPRTVSEVQPMYDSHFYTDIDPWQKMIYAKRVDQLQPMIKKVVWTSGKKYAQWDPKDPELENKEYLVLVDNSRIYKCLSNSNGKPSTVKPTSTVVGAPIRLTDGYVWYYMTALPSEFLNQWQNETYIPIYSSDSETAAASVDGSIMAAKIIEGGENYPFLRGKISSYEDADVAARPRSVIMVDIDSDVTTTNNPFTQPNYFSQSSVLISDATSGYRELITVVESSYITFQVGDMTIRRMKLVLAEETKTFTPSVNSRVYVAPSMYIQPYNRQTKIYNYSGEDVETTPCFMMPIINEENGAIADVEVIKAGSGYREAKIQVRCNKTIDNPAIIEPIISPIDYGHGGFLERESHVKAYGVSVEIAADSEFRRTIPYSQVGLIVDPLRVQDVSSELPPFQARQPWNQSQRAAYTEFVQILDVSITPIDSTYASFSTGEEVFAEASGRRGLVAYVDGSSLGLVGIEGMDLSQFSDDFFFPEEILSNADGSKKWRVQADPINRQKPKVNSTPEMKLFTGEILYVQNIPTAVRATDESLPETVKLILKF